MFQPQLRFQQLEGRRRPLRQTRSRTDERAGDRLQVKVVAHEVGDLGVGEPRVVLQLGGHRLGVRPDQVARCAQGVRNLFRVTALHAFSATRTASHRNVELRGHRRHGRQIGLKLLMNFDVLHGTAAIRAVSRRNIDLPINLRRPIAMRGRRSFLTPRLLRLRLALPPWETAGLPLRVLLGLFPFLLQPVNLRLQFRVLFLQLRVLLLELRVLLLEFGDLFVNLIHRRAQTLQFAPQQPATRTTQIDFARIHRERRIR